MSKPSNVVDVTDPARNLFGCSPCPECGSEFREPREGVIHCYDCGEREDVLPS